MHGHKICLMDVKTAFSPGDIYVEIYIKPSPAPKVPNERFSIC